MNSGQLFELAIIAFIAIGIGVAVWKGGAANPVGTGALQMKLKSVSSDLSNMRGSVNRLADDFSALQGRAVSGEEIERMNEKLEAEIRRTDKVFASLEILGQDIHALREGQSAKNVVIESLSEGLRAVSHQITEHREDVNRRLDQLGAMVERIEANRRAIEGISEQLPSIRDKQDRMSAEVSATSSDVKLIGRQVDRLYDVIVTRGMQS